MEFDQADDALGRARGWSYRLATAVTDAFAPTYSSSRVAMPSKGVWPAPTTSFGLVMAGT